MAVDMTRCKPMTIITNRVQLIGGRCTKPMQANTKSVQVGHSRETFVKLAGTEAWLSSAVTGQKSGSTSFQRTTLLNSLRGHVEQACSGVLKTKEPEAAVAAEEDPMDDIDDEMPEKMQKTNAHGGGRRDATRVRYQPRSNQAKGKILEVEMPVACPEEDPDAVGGKRTVSLFIVDRQQLWLNSNDVDWAVRYLYVQNLLRGVPLVSPTDKGPGSPATTVSSACSEDRGDGGFPSSPATTVPDSFSGGGDSQ